MALTTFAAQTSEASSGMLGFSVSTFLIQLITFVLVFLVLKRFAFKPITKLLEKRRQTIEDGILLSEKMKQQEAELDETIKKTMSKARQDADRIIDNAHKESRLVLRRAEVDAKAKYEAVLKDAQQRIDEETLQAQQKLKGDLVELVSEATEVVVHEKINQSKDAQLISQALKGQDA